MLSTMFSIALLALASTTMARTDYASLNALLQDLGLLDDEGMHVELKAAAGGLPDSIWRSVSAFSNSDSGWILLGVTNEKVVVGVEDPDQLQGDFASTLEATITPTISPLLQTFAVAGHRVLGIRIPKLEAYLRPAYLTRSGIHTGSYKRIGSSSVRFSDQDFARVFAERAGMSPDSHLPDDASLDDIDDDLVERYRQRLQAVRPGSPLIGYGREELLLGLGAAVRASGGLTLNRAGLLLFGKQTSLARFFPGCSIQLLEIEGTEWNPSPGNRGRTLQLPLVGLVELASTLITEVTNRVPEAVALTVEALQRTEDPVRVAVREAVVNALVHQNFLAFRPTQIRRYSDRLELENPGHSPKPVANFSQPGSAPRNPIIARAFNLVGLAEQVGSGILTMINAFKSAGLTAPKFNSDEAADQFSVAFYWHNLAPKRGIEWLEKVSGLDGNQRRALLHALRSGVIGNATYRGITGLDVVQASRSLRQMVELGLLVKVGGGSASHYVVSVATRRSYELAIVPEVSDR